MQNFKIFLFVVLTVIGTDSSVVRKNTREFLQLPEDHDSGKMGDEGVLALNDLLTDTDDEFIANGGEFLGDMKNDLENSPALTSSRIQDASNGESGTPELKCYGSTSQWPLPYVEIPCTGSCYLSRHWSPLGNRVERGCSPKHRQTRTIYRPTFMKYCNRNLCNLR